VNKKKYICIHGHFYQPPRENAWLETIETQLGAAPYHDWNERINNECYAPNAAARVLDREGKIIRILNNYRHISFNMGPTLMSWLEAKDPATYRAIVQADRDGAAERNGHGPAVAQAYNHIIMPLASPRDRETQVIWGIADFTYRFGRKPEGMWLPETAVDTATLECLVDQGIKFTILAPRQCRSVKMKGSDEWISVYENGFDTRIAYEIPLPSGRTIAVFFYNGPISQKIAFEGVLNDGAHFARQLMSSLDDSDTPQLVHVATDGESYGHHHKNGEMALAACISTIEQSEKADFTNYAHFLSLAPPSYEAQIHENSSWSCVHGVERWRSNCGCSTGGDAGWHQHWRRPLREALDWLSNSLAASFEQLGKDFFDDPWQVRNQFISLVLNRTPEATRRFLQKHVHRSLNTDETTRAIRLLEIQRNAMLMYTSCGWFFNDISGLETTQLMQYAARAMDYLRKINGTDLETNFVRLLSDAHSNDFHAVNGARIYTETIGETRTLLEEVGRHYAVNSLFSWMQPTQQLYTFNCKNEHAERHGTDNYRLSVGRVRMRSSISQSQLTVGYAVFYFGDLNLIGGLVRHMSEEAFQKLRLEVVRLFESKTDLESAKQLLKSHFDDDTFDIRDLFVDDRQKLINDITKPHHNRVEKALRLIYDEEWTIMKIIKDYGVEVHEHFRHAAQYVLNLELRRQFHLNVTDPQKFEEILKQFDQWNLHIIEPSKIKWVTSRYFSRQVELIIKGDQDIAISLIEVLRLCKNFKINADFWKAQNLLAFYLSQPRDFVADDPILDLASEMGLNVNAFVAESLSSHKVESLSSQKS
jgi:alpha-amylase/alpha-mannosidase (GH57 family)